MQIALVEIQPFGIVGNRHLVPSLTSRGRRLEGRPMQRKSKVQDQTADWLFTLKRIGEELRDVDSTPENFSPELSAIVTLHRQIEVTKQELGEAESESCRLVAHIKEVLAQGF